MFAIMSYTLLVYAVEPAATIPGMPSYADILSAMNGVATILRGWESMIGFSVGGWIGPRPRVTRITQPSVTQGYITRVAWVWQIPGAPANAARMKQFLQQAVQQALGGTETIDRWSVNVTEWSEATNGPLSWWQNGQAANTRTFDRIEQFADRLNADENPIGPDQNLGSNGLRDTADAAKTIAIVGGVAVGLYLLWPLLAGARRAMSPARANPSVSPWHEKMLGTGDSGPSRNVCQCGHWASDHNRHGCKLCSCDMHPTGKPGERARDRARVRKNPNEGGQITTARSIISLAKVGDRVAIEDRFGKKHWGRVAIKNRDSLALNMGGKHGTPGVATERNVVGWKPGKSRKSALDPYRDGTEFVRPCTRCETGRGGHRADCPNFGDD